jgi:hypothetical protein
MDDQCLIPAEFVSSPERAFTPDAGHTGTAPEHTGDPLLRTTAQK